jgi:hypothetical protein
MNGGHERKFLEEAGSSFVIPHEEKYLGNLSSADLITACGDLSLKNFVASRCLARRLEWEDKEAKESSATAANSLQNRVAELERRLAAEQVQSQQLLRAKEDEAKASHATLEALCLDMEKLASARGDLDVQLRDKDAEFGRSEERSELPEQRPGEVSHRAYPMCGNSAFRSLGAIRAMQP